MNKQMGFVISPIKYFSKIKAIIHIGFLINLCELQLFLLKIYSFVCTEYNNLLCY